ncbi:unnamed protein product [Pelagomonas calceolata]|uniref:Uncharacterized protein n=1 Tax=Pelagomonas calceolata TaxID=35677 RepID=A0A8J2WD35_9STRA|nr:unnamed protein product [Pelagomonas calceolata]CAH0375616.1 unnamed protein product [Pelagomonas calceolata]
MPTPVPAPKKVMAHRAVRPRLNTSDAASPIIAPAPELRTTRSSNVSQRALMMSSLGSDFFAGGAFLAASSAMVSTYALRRRRAVARLSLCDARTARARILGLGPRATTRQRAGFRGHHLSATGCSVDEGVQTSSDRPVARPRPSYKVWQAGELAAVRH